MTVERLIGPDFSQVSRNRDLGRLAFLDTPGYISNINQETNTSNIKPTLLLDFANSKVLDGRVSYSRASTATYYDGVTFAKAEENMLLYSQEFSNTVGWSSGRITITDNAVAAPDGTTTADAITQATGQTTSGFLQVLGMQILPAGYTLSVYAKPNGKNFIMLQTNGSLIHRTWFNISTGAVGTSTGHTNATITSAGNGWYRCSITTTLATDASTNIYLADSDNSVTVVASGGVYLWGAQLEQKTNVSAYNMTTSQPVLTTIPVLLSAAIDTPRFDHDPITGESEGLLIEDQKTNLITYSSQFDNAAWTKSVSASILANQIIAPDGTLSADLLTGTQVNNGVYQNVTVSNATSYCSSVFIKAGSANYVMLRDDLNNIHVTVNMNTSSIAFVNGAVNSGVIPVGNGWLRVFMVYTTTSTTARLFVRPTATAGTVYVWGAQIEAGLYPTSYIPTTTSSVTRSYDSVSMTGTNFSSWYRQDEGTVVITADTPLPITVTPYSVVCFSDGTVANRMMIRMNSSSSPASYTLGIVSSSNVWQNMSIENLIAYTPITNVLAYKANNVGFTGSGMKVVEKNSNTVPVVNQMWIGSDYTFNQAQMNGHVKRLVYYPRRLNNEELQEISL